MTRRTSRVPVDRGRAAGFAESGRRFLEGARSEMQLGNWDSAAVLFVHAAIAYADAVAVHRRGERSAGESRLDSVSLFGDAAKGVAGRDEAVRHLRRLIEEKTRVSYLGNPIRKAEAEALRQHADRLQSFCVKVLGA